MLLQAGLQQCLHLLGVCVVKTGTVAGDVRAQDAHARLGVHHLHGRGGGSGDRFFEKQHWHALRQAREQLLRPLVDKVPAQV